ncbi:hypothetical protein [Blastomonas sp.]|uniref:hypothetical protein n=1 Tax=Blastomonas sp. TaxID=1909299 RepID=UPI0039193D0C
MRRFEHYACFDWSGQAVARPKGLALATIGAEEGARPVLLRPQGGWSRGAALEWMLAHAQAGTDMLIGLDLSPTFPFVDAGGYFPEWDQSPADARTLWAMVDRICEGDAHMAASSFVGHVEARRYFRHGKGDTGDRFGLSGVGRLREVERHQRLTGQANSQSCFNLVGAAQVGKSSLTGMRLLHRLAGRIPIWPFDPVPQAGPVIVEIYTSIAARAAGLGRARSKVRDADGLHSALDQLGAFPPAPLIAHDDHSTDALITAAWLRNAVHDIDLWNPPALDESIRVTEGWTFGVK